MRVRALASAIGIGPVTIAGALMMGCGLRWQAWTLLLATAGVYFFWIMTSKGEK